ncbi:ribosomal protein L7Ae [Ruminococcus callidus ATCC 27760]|uniref:Ribosomal protein L7Ae n=2 Tax=Ruminococcus callidus TaxID=40519 RepID=U2KH45_9FIRM|nr:ribosomal protein L7Ae [Ruminococcus callidus ATCC 27760]
MQKGKSSWISQENNPDAVHIYVRIWTASQQPRRGTALSVLSAAVFRKKSMRRWNMHYRQNWQGILSICRKAGKLAMGLEPTKDAMYRGTVSGVLVASDASAKTRKEAAFYCGQAQVPCLELAFTKADFAQMIGRGSGVLAICDDGFFRKMQLLAEQEKQEPRGEA